MTVDDAVAWVKARPIPTEKSPELLALERAVPALLNELAMDEARERADERKDAAA